MQSQPQQIIDITPTENENLNDFLLRLGQLKEDGAITCTWEDIAVFIGGLFPEDKHNESWCRRHYKKLKTQRLTVESQSEDSDSNTVIDYFKALQKERNRIKDERLSIYRNSRETSRRDELFELFETEIQKAVPIKNKGYTSVCNNKALYVCLSDLHYGATFNSVAGVYDSEIAWERVLKYAEEIKAIGEKEGCSDVYVSLMGDMISGNIHATTRIENREDIVGQIIGASELSAEFLRQLAGSFNSVFVNAVPGNHSRIDPNMDNTLRNERMDNLITYYCKVKLENISNIHFQENGFDSTVGVFEIFGKTYACVHGDMDPNMRASASRISSQLRKPLYCLLLGHLHVASLDMEDVVYVRNGSVCGSGDEFTMKKRLFGDPIQVCLCVSERGIEGYYPINLL